MFEFRRLLLSLVSLLGIAWLAGCMEDTIQNEIVTPIAGGTIYGRVTPAEPGTEVSAWQATQVKSTIVDSEGFFSISDLPPGLYKVVVNAPSGAHRTIRDVAVDRTRSASLGIVDLTLPDPLVELRPGDGDADVGLNYVFISLLSAEELDVRSLDAAVQFEPQLEGFWTEDYPETDSHSYSFRPTAGLEPSTTYRVHIGSNLRLESGEEWGSTYDYSFTTQDFSLIQLQFFRSANIPALYHGRFAVLYFNTRLDVGSLSGAIRVEPPVQISVSEYGTNAIAVSLDGELVADSNYDLIIGTELSDSHGHHLKEPESRHFSTDPLQVTSAVFTGESGNSISPSGDLAASVNFNSRVDIDAFNAAAAFEPPIPGFWVVTQVNENETNPGLVLQFFWTGPSLVPDQEYRFRIDGTAPLAGDAALGAEFSRTFHVEPVAISGVSPANGSRGMPLWTSVRVVFNTPMVRASTESAFSLQRMDGEPVAGYFYWSGTGFEFQTIQSLQPTTSYRITVSTSAVSQLGPPLKAKHVSIFRTGQ